MKNIYLGYIAPLSVLIPVTILLVWNTRFALAKHIKILFAYLIMSYFIGRESAIMAEKNIPNLWLLHFYTIGEGCLLIFFFRLIFQKNTHRRLAGWLLLVFPLFCVVNMLFFQSLSVFNTYARSLEVIIIMALCIIFWWQPSAEQEKQSWAQTPENWMVAGIFIYFSASFFLFLLSNYLQAWMQRSTGNWIPFTLLWYGHATLVIIMYLFFSIGFLKCRPQTTTYST
jgi:hypothetical protein